MRFFKTGLAIVCGLILTATGLWAGGDSDSDSDGSMPAATDKETVFDPASGQTWTAPEYGGTLTWAPRHYPVNADVWSASGWAAHFYSGVLEQMAFGNWDVDRELVTDMVWAYTGPQMYGPGLATSWEMPDESTFIWHVRQGVHWHDKAPVNGREFNAHDVVWNYERYAGIARFADLPPAPHPHTLGGLEFDSVTATDNYTVEFKLTNPLINAEELFLNKMTPMYAPEVYVNENSLEDWRNLVGTGPYELTEFVEGASQTYIKNPDYWGVDEKFGNPVPYIDELRSVLLPDEATRIAALRSRKVDYVGNPGDSQISNVDTIESLQKSNPELQFHFIVNTPGALIFNQSLPLTQDVRVRKALQMAVDNEAINASIYKGLGIVVPYGIYMPNLTDWVWSYEEWPDEVKREYEYRPEDAEALLDEAGYPRGADGVRFKLAASNSPRQEPTYIEIVGEFFRAVGVDLEISTHTEAEGAAAWSADTHEFDMYCCAQMGTRRPALWIAGTVTQDVAGNSLTKSRDPRLETFYNGATHAADLEEFYSNIREIDEIVIREHFGLVRPMVPLYQVAQPWVQGWNGEWGMGYAERHTHFSRLWIDSALKNEMTGN